MIRPLDVIVVFDGTIRPPAPKMMACIHPANGWFYRINSKGHWRPRVPLLRAEHPSFLEHDSFLECGDPLELDEYLVEQALKRPGIIGAVNPRLCPQIIAALESCRTLLPRDKREIVTLLGDIG